GVDAWAAGSMRRRWSESIDTNVWAAIDPPLRSLRALSRGGAAGAPGRGAALALARQPPDVTWIPDGAPRRGACVVWRSAMVSARRRGSISGRHSGGPVAADRLVAHDPLPARGRAAKVIGFQTSMSVRRAIARLAATDSTLLQPAWRRGDGGGAT